jgi:hypothetical protein
MNQLYGMGITGLSVMCAALVSGFRLKPYIDAGVERTPMTFAAYPAAIAVAITIPIVLFIHWWTGQKTINLGPISFTGNLSFIALGCLLYILIAVSFFPYQPVSPSPTDKPASMQHVRLFPR